MTRAPRTRAPRTRWGRLVAPVLLTGALLASGLLPVAPTLQGVPQAHAAPAPEKSDSSAGSEGSAGSAWEQSRTLTRTFANADGSTTAMPANEVTVHVDKTKDLRGRQRVQVSWTGAQPSGGRAANPFGENGLAQEYPVVVLQCRGTDAPGAKVAVSPETCWTVSVAQRSRVAVNEGEAIWVKDALATEEQRARYSSSQPVPDAETCPDADKPPFFTHLTPFVSAKGTVHQACDATNMAPEAAVGAAFPPNEIAAFTRTDGTGEVQFEVRSDAENESLGCNSGTPCSIVVIPINGLSCAAPSTPASTADKLCRRTGQFAPGSSNFRGDGVDAAVSPQLWWSPSNWQNRFTVPITFGLPPDTCEVLDSRAPTAFYGSELLAQAALQWAPAYCLNKSRFKYQHNQMSDEAGWNLMENGGGVAAAVSSAHQRTGQDPVAYAPTAVTGFSIGYVIDRPDNVGELQELKLNGRLLAKLMTQSYLASDLGRGHPGIEENPLGLMSDPEFQKLNPGLSTVDQEAGAALLNLSNSSDVITQLTSYIATDPEAMTWINGAADPWGMKVNPAYEKLSLPRAEWPLLDEYVPETENSCRKANPAVYFSQVAAPVVNLRRIAEALLDGWPNVQTKCDYDPATTTYKVGRTDRQAYGARFMVGVVSLGDASRYGLRNASLQTKGGTFVAPTRSSLAAAVDLSERAKGRWAPFELDQEKVRRQRSAYPGTMVVYTAARTRGLAAEDATKVAQFIRIATSEGQRQGSGNGQLPEGFLPIRQQGSTRKLYEAAREAADAIEAQKPAPQTKPTPTPGPETPGGGTSPDGGTDTGTPGAVAPGKAATPGTATPTPKATTTPGPDAERPQTAAVSSATSDRMMVGLLAVCVLGLVVAAGSRFLIRPTRTPRTPRRPGGAGAAGGPGGVGGGTA